MTQKNTIVPLFPIRTNAELLLAIYDEDELEAMHPAKSPIKQPETAFCCMKSIDHYEPICPHCGGDPYPF